MTMPRKLQRTMIMQSFRLMLSSGVLRPACTDPHSPATFLVTSSTQADS